MEQVLLSIQVGKWVLIQHQKIRTPAHTGAWHTHVYTHTHPQARREPAARLLPYLLLEGQRAPPHCLTSPLGNSSGWAEPLYLSTGYLEHLLNPNCTGEVHSTLNHDQPDARQNLKHRPTLSTMRQVILPHFSGEVQQSKHHPHHKDSFFSKFSAVQCPKSFNHL